MKKTSSTGINTIIDEESIKESIIFNDTTCPHCDHQLYIDTRRLHNFEIDIRYKCHNCDFICPIMHDCNDPKVLSPSYDDSIYNFIQDFGKDIRESRIKNNYTKHF